MFESNRARVYMIRLCSGLHSERVLDIATSDARLICATCTPTSTMRKSSQMGHTTPSLTLALYGREMHRRDGERDRLKALVARSPPSVVSGSRFSTTSSTQIRISRRHGAELIMALGARRC